MGVGGSKDDRGVRVLQALPPGFLDEKGKELRDKLDWCLEQNGWYFTIGGGGWGSTVCVCHAVVSNSSLCVCIVCLRKSSKIHV
jgi:hypothetical protein